VTSSTVGRQPARLVRQPPHHAVARHAFASAAATPAVRVDDTTRQDRTTGFEPLPDDLKAELVEPAERGQVRAGKASTRGSVRRVEVFRMGSVRTSIFGRPRRLPGDRRGHALYTLNCEEPVMHQYVMLLEDKGVKVAPYVTVAAC